MSEDNFNEENEEIEESTEEASEGGFSSMFVDTTNEVVKRQLRGMFQSWYLDYASYTILDRAIPHINDGLKPVQRRLLHAMKTLDDGRFNKVANIVGNTMQYHPHGDSSIYGALVQLGQKNLLVDTQGNWGNVLTGASAAAGRYIEARLSQFALDTLYNAKITEWTLSYDGRKREPVTLPSKFPLLLFQGVVGLAAGLSSLILPHNFNEIIDAAVAHLSGEEFELYPDFETGGFIDVSRYNDGSRGGRVKVRAKIEKLDNKTLAITEIPFGRTTEAIGESIVAALEKGKIKVRKVEDMTSEEALILVHLQPGASSDKTIDALYAFTDCEVPLSPNCCVIMDNKPHFMGVSDLLRHSAERTRELLRQELEIQRGEYYDQLNHATLEKIFIEHRIYKDKEFEQSTSKEEAIRHIEKRIERWKKQLVREVTDDDLLRLLEIKMARILRFKVEEADRVIAQIKEKIELCEKHLSQITDYTIEWFRGLKEKYGAAYPRKTVIRNFDNIQASNVVEANEKLYFNRKEGFAGTSLKKDEFICNCSSIDDVIIFYRDGKYKVTRIQDKFFVGKDVEYINVFKRNDARTIYNVIYKNGKEGPYMMKRFAVTGVTRDTVYDVTKGAPGSYIKYFSANSNGEAEVVKVILKPNPRLKNIQFDVDFGQLAVRQKGSLGNLVTRNDILRVVLKERGASTLGGIKVWFDSDILRLNTAGQGDYLGEFQGNDRLLVIGNNGLFHTTNYDLNNHYEPSMLIEKFNPSKVWTAVLFDADQGFWYLKRFTLEDIARPQSFIGENPKSKLLHLTSSANVRFRVIFGGEDKLREPLVVEAHDFVGIKSFKAKGKRLTNFKVDEIIMEFTDEKVEPELIEDVEATEVTGEEGFENEAKIEEKSDEELLDELNGQQRIF